MFMRRLQKNVSVLSRLGLMPLGVCAWLGLAPAPAWAQPANDNFANAQVLSGRQGSTTVDNTGATAEPNEPSHAGFAATNSIWFRWTAPTSGEITLDTIGSDFIYTNIVPIVDTNGVQTGLSTNIYYLPLDTVLAVYTGTNISQLVQIAANDDFYPFNHYVETSLTSRYQ